MMEFSILAGRGYGDQVFLICGILHLSSCKKGVVHILVSVDQQFWDAEFSVKIARNDGFLPLPWRPPR